MSLIGPRPPCSHSRFNVVFWKRSGGGESTSTRLGPPRSIDHAGGDWPDPHDGGPSFRPWARKATESPCQKNRNSRVKSTGEAVFSSHLKNPLDIFW